MSLGPNSNFFELSKNLKITNVLHTSSFSYIRGYVFSSKLGTCRHSLSYGDHIIMMATSKQNAARCKRHDLVAPNATKQLLTQPLEFTGRQHLALIPVFQSAARLTLLQFIATKEALFL